MRAVGCDCVVRVWVRLVSEYQAEVRRILCVEGYFIAIEFFLVFD